MVDGTMGVTGKVKVKRWWSILPLSGNRRDVKASSTFAVHGPGNSEDEVCMSSLKTGELTAMTFFGTRK